MSENKYLLPMAPIVVGFVISCGLIGASLGYFRSGGMIGAGILVFIMSLGLLFIVRGENENITDQGIPDWRNINDEDNESALFDQQAERSMLVEAGLADLDIVETRLRQGTYLLRSMAALSVFGILLAALQIELTLVHGLIALLLPYLIWSAYWGAVSIFARSPNLEHRDVTFDPAERATMGNMRGPEAIAVIASLFYGVLGAGPIEYFRHRQTLALAGLDEAR